MQDENKLLMNKVFNTQNYTKIIYLPLIELYDNTVSLKWYNFIIFYYIKCRKINSNIYKSRPRVNVKQCYTDRTAVPYL